jgi:hypothetical protein
MLYVYENKIISYDELLKMWTLQLYKKKV